MARSRRRGYNRGMDAKDQARDGERTGLYGQRPSASHDALVRTEFARIAAMSARERMEEALRLERELEELVPKDGDQSSEEGSPP